MFWSWRWKKTRELRFGESVKGEKMLKTFCSTLELTDNGKSIQ